MKNIIFLIILYVGLTCIQGMCNEVIIDNFDTLIHTQYYAGNIVTFTSGFTSEGDIGNIFPNIDDITIEGHNFVINGNDEYSGFIVNSQADFNQLDLSHCKGQTINNSSYAGGILNNGGNIHVTYAALSENFADAAGFNFSYGGAIYNTNGGYTDIDTVLFDGNHTNGALSTGGAISNGAYNNNDADMDIYNSIFQNNSTYATVNSEGGAIFNSGTLDIKTSTFRNNLVNGDNGISLSGGAIYNSGEINIDDVRFFDNIVGNGGLAYGNGGAIHNIGSLIINESTFDGNSVNSSGAGEGGAIYNNTGTTLSITNSTFQNNSTNGALFGEGGAIYNNSNANLSITNSTFQNNFTNASQSGEGGAIYNNSDANLSITNSTFQNNSTNASQSGEGGAIYNNSDANLSITNSLFQNNSTNASQSGEGGAIYNNSDANLSITNSTFQNNSTNASQSGEGGAIYNTGHLVIINSTFQNNTQSNNEENDIYNTSAASTEFAGSGTTNILSGISGAGTISKTGDGILNLGGLNSNYTGDFNFSGGTVNLLINSSYFSAQNTHFSNNVNFNLQNGDINNINFGNLILDGRTNLSADMNLNSGIMDTIAATSLTGTGNIFVSSLGIEGIPESEYMSIPFADSVLKNDVSYTPSRINTPIYEYNVTYNSTNGHFEISREKFNSGIFSSQVATQLAGYLTQIDTYKNIFSNLDMVMITPPGSAKISYENKIAYTNPNFTYSPLQMPEQRPGIWFKPYTTFESVRLKNGPKVSNVSYGSLLGIESGLNKLKNDWYSLYGLYASYNGSHQAFSGNDIYNNGGILGVDAVFYKGNFFTAWTIDAGANASEASTALGRENFSMVMAGIAQKTGYNIEIFERKLIIQPSVLTSYTFVNTFDHKGVQNVNINTRPLNALQIEPGIKLIANSKKYLQPYIHVSMVWNLIDSAKFRADDVFLPNLTVKPFVQYGVGVQKRYGERITGFLEAMIRNGGREGVALQFGLRISI